jgi:hypothetical protein
VPTVRLLRNLPVGKEEMWQLGDAATIRQRGDVARRHGRHPTFCARTPTARTGNFAVCGGGGCGDPTRKKEEVEVAAPARGDGGEGPTGGDLWWWWERGSRSVGQWAPVGTIQRS